MHRTVHKLRYSKERRHERVPEMDHLHDSGTRLLQLSHVRCVSAVPENAMEWPLANDERAKRTRLGSL